MLKDRIEAFVDVERFSMRTLLNEVWPLVEDHASLTKNSALLKVSTAQTGTKSRQGVALYKKLSGIIVRHVFLIELVKLPKVESTKFRVRWCGQLENETVDDQEHQQRHCSFDDCVQIAGDILGNLASGWLDVPDNRETLQLFLANPLLPYEAPIDYYKSVPRSDSRTRIHRPGNIGLVSTPKILQTLRLRKLLTDPKTSPDPIFFDMVLRNKIKTKTYLTDRVLTGNHKTNREKRWEAHPHAEHFATRSDCLEIEHSLITQLMHFDGFPEASRKLLQEQAAVPMSDKVVSCPITLEPLNFSAFREALLNAKHGRSDFQVGHLNPLKLGELGSAIGHTAANISWVSADGNRIQGSYSLARTRALVYEIGERYKAAGIVPEIKASIRNEQAEFAEEEVLVAKEEAAVAKTVAETEGLYVLEADAPLDKTPQDSLALDL